MLAQIATSHQHNVYLAYTWQLAGTSSVQAIQGRGKQNTVEVLYLYAGLE